MNDDHELSGGKAFLFTLITCGIYSYYWNYKMGKELYEAKTKRGLSGNDNAEPLLYLHPALIVPEYHKLRYCICNEDNAVSSPPFSNAHRIWDNLPSYSPLNIYILIIHFVWV